jgi:aminomethyltransferase
MESTETPKTTPLYPAYSERSEAKLVPFRGWLLPLHFENGIITEHRTVRDSAGLFDVSHMGEIEITGDGSGPMLDTLCTNDISALKPGRALYTPLCREDGGTLDDVLLYRTGESSYLMVTNAGNTEKLLGWLEVHSAGCQVRDRSDEYTLLALQGPRAEPILSSLTDGSVDKLSPFALAQDIRIDGISTLISRTGYTGEDGFEIFTGPEDAPEIWKRLLTSGADKGLEPCGLGARDTLRLEAGFPLYGHELDETISPVEAGLEKFVRFEGDDFVGKKSLAKQAAGDLIKRRIGLRLIDPGMPRKGQKVRLYGEEIGFITSGTRSPTEESFIAMAFLDPRYAISGKKVTLDVNGRSKQAEIVDLPFYKKKP